MYDSIYATGVNSEGVYTPDELVIKVGSGRKLTFAQGHGVIARGAVVGIVTATGKAVPCVATANDGSQVPDSIVADPTVDTTAGDAEGMTYERGTFNARSLILDASLTLASIDLPLRTRGIIIQNSVA